MRSFLREMEEKFIEIEKLPTEEEEVELDEINTTGAVASYNTPGAFLTPAQYEKKKKKIKYETVTSKPTQTTEDILEKKYEELLESYRRFATEDKTLSPEQKVKTTIKDIAKKLQEIETIVNYNTRLKTESGISASTYGSSTQKALTKISERLIKISERVRALGE
jgi:uncharacterized FlaG/YvyC family protein